MKITEDQPSALPGSTRRGFLGAIAAGTAAGLPIASAPARANSGQTANEAMVAAKSPVGPPSAVLALDEIGPVPQDPSIYVGRTGSDFMVDVIKSLDISYCALLPGSTFRALQESIINYGNNTAPQIITCTNEDISVSLAHGYAKVAGKPMMSLCHGVVGLQHASMSIYNAWCDRVPMIVVVGNTLDEAARPPIADWVHSAQDNASIVRDFVKWDDQPVSLAAFAMSFVRAKDIATAMPQAPVLIVADNAIAEAEIRGREPLIPMATSSLPPVGDPDAIVEAARLLAGAQRPVIVVDRLVRSQHGMDMLVQLAELLGAPVIDIGSRLNMPTRHRLNLTWQAQAMISATDVLLALEPVNLFSVLVKFRDLPDPTFTPLLPEGAQVISISTDDLLIHANFQDFQRYQPVNLQIDGDGEASLPSLIEAVRRVMGKRDVSARVAKYQSMSDAMHAHFRQAATFGWKDSPITVPRICAELGYVLRDTPWALVTPQEFQGSWPSKLWDFRHAYQYIGNSGGFGVGYEPGASVGAALAHQATGRGRVPVGILGDGALMMNPGALWTAAHHRIPILWVMHNNRGWHQELMHIQRMADRHQRGVNRANIGAVMTNPNIDFAKMAESMGVWSAGPISDPEALRPALQQALAMVQSGAPALVDVVAQGR